MGMPPSKKLYDDKLSGEGCENKCLEAGGGYYTEFPTGWCTVLTFDAECETLDDQPGQCGSTGVGAKTYKFETDPVGPDSFPTYPAIVNAVLVEGVIPGYTGCHDSPGKAALFCAEMIDDGEPCVGFSYVESQDCPEGQQKYSFSCVFKPVRPPPANLDTYSISVSGQCGITPCAVQLMFKFMSGYSLVDADKKPYDVATGNSNMPQQKCESNAACTAYQWDYKQDEFPESTAFSFFSEVTEGDLDKEKDCGMPAKNCHNMFIKQVPVGSPSSTSLVVV